MEYFLSILWTGIELLVITFAVNTFFPARFSKRTTALAFAITWGLFFVELYFMGLSDLQAQFVSLFVMILYSVICFRAAVLYHVLCALMVFLSFGVMDTAVGYGISALLGITFHEFVWKKLLYSAVVTTTKCAELIAAYLFWRYFSRRKLPAIRGSWLLLSILFPAVSLVMLLVIFITFRQDGDLAPGALVFAVAVGVANVAILYLIHIMEKRTREEEQLHLMNQQMEIQTGSILALERSYRAQRAATHEFQNQLRILGDLLAGKQYEEAEGYLKQLQASQSARVLSVNTHHPIMDAILNQKYQLAKESGIDIQFQVNDLSGIRMETDAIVVLFSNLLDNAIEACQRLPDNRVILCTILASDELYISIKNTSPPVTITNGTIPTSKASRAEHGFGLLSIRRVLDRHRSEYSFQYRDGWFQFAAEIPLE